MQLTTTMQMEPPMQVTSNHTKVSYASHLATSDLIQDFFSLVLDYKQPYISVHSQHSHKYTRFPNPSCYYTQPHYTILWPYLHYLKYGFFLSSLQTSDDLSYLVLMLCMSIHPTIHPKRPSQDFPNLIPSLFSLNS